MVQLLFAQSFPNLQPVDKAIQPIVEHLSTIDARVQEIAPEYPLDNINKIDLAILRLATYEILIEKEAPQKVIIDEAIELGKEFGGDSSPGFINGALGKLIKDQESSKES